MKMGPCFKCYTSLRCESIHTITTKSSITPIITTYLSHMGHVILHIIHDHVLAPHQRGTRYPEKKRSRVSKPPINTKMQAWRHQIGFILVILITRSGVSEKINNVTIRHFVYVLDTV